MARLQEENRELKSKIQSLTDSNGGIPLDLSREFEQRVKRLAAELEVVEDQRRKATQEVVKLQSQLSESQHAARGHKEVLVNEVSCSPCALSIQQKFRFQKFWIFFTVIGTVHSGCIDPIQGTARLVILLEGGIQKSDTVTTILSNGKGHFSATDRNDRTGQSVSPRNIPVGPNRNGPFHLVSK